MADDTTFDERIENPEFEFQLGQMLCVFEGIAGGGVKSEPLSALKLEGHEVIVSGIRYKREGAYWPPGPGWYRAQREDLVVINADLPTCLPDRERDLGRALPAAARRLDPQPESD